MKPSETLQARCIATVADLNQRQGWDLSLETQQEYKVDLLRCLPEDVDDDKLRSIVVIYHEDHELVHALQNCSHIDNNLAWIEWMNKAAAFLQHAGLFWSRDVAVDADDLAQMALADLIGSINSFRYESHFSTWAYRVIVRSAQRHIRHLNAQKRNGITVSYEQLSETANDVESHPDILVENALFVAFMVEVLKAEANNGERLARIFQLWFDDKMSPEEIAKHMHLSASRVRSLLKYARSLLIRHAAIRDWYGDDRMLEYGDPGMEY